MQCPNCGFENIPGLEMCGVCSAALAPPPEATAVFPPRARDRGARERIAVTLARGHMRSIGRPNELAMARRADEAPPLPARASLLLLCTIPGMGQRLVQRDRTLSRWHMGAAAAALALAALFYRWRVSDVLLLVVAGLSVASVAACIGGWNERNVTDDARSKRQLATVLMTVSAYALASFVLPLALMPIAQVQTVVRETATPVLRQGDSALFRPLGAIRRGDIVAGLQARHVAGLGPVVGLPGEIVTVTSAGTIAVNGRVTSVVLNPRGERSSEPASVTLGDEQYWVPPNVEWLGTEGNGVTWAGTIASTGIMDRPDMVGRAVAIVEPPIRRRIIPRLPIFEPGR